MTAAEQNRPTKKLWQSLFGASELKARLDRRFGLAEEINGAERCATYLFRWIVLDPRGWSNSTSWWKSFFFVVFGDEWKLYLHKFVGSDWARDLHDHPKRFISVGLWGAYVEESYVGDGLPSRFKVYRAPWVRSFPPEHRHRLALRHPDKPCWTLVLVLKTEREWGFWHEGRFIHWLSYVRGADRAIADKMKDCA